MNHWMSGRDARILLSRAGVPFAPWEIVTSAQDAAAASRRIAGRLAVKTAAVDIVHKSDVGCVLLGLDGPDAVARAYDRIVERAADAGSAHATAVMVEGMVPDSVGEVLLGIVRDPTFGPVLVVGLGGIWVEVLQDVARRLCPVSTEEAVGMLRGLKGAPMLDGGRGRARADLPALGRIAAGLSALAMRDPRIEQIDLNPVLALPGGAVAVDARVLLNNEEPRTHEHA